MLNKLNEIKEIISIEEANYLCSLFNKLDTPEDIKMFLFYFMIFSSSIFLFTSTPNPGFSKALTYPFSHFIGSSKI